MNGIKRRGFASMSQERRRELASLGGRAAQASGKAHRFTSEEGRAAGRRGGLATLSKYGPSHYSDLGQCGGMVVSANSAYMAEIGRRGGEKTAQARKAVTA